MDIGTKERFIGYYRSQLSQWLNQFNNLLAMKKQYDSLDLGNVLENGDFTGAHEGITKTEFLAAVSSVDAVDTLMKTGHYTNFYKVAV